MQMWKKILIGLVLGVLAGTLFPESASYLKPFGQVFINLIKMLIVPLIFFSLISGITSMEETGSMGRLSVKAFGLYLGTTAVAITLGLGVATILEPGVGSSIDFNALESNDTPKAEMNAGELLVSLVPANPIAAMAEGNILQVIVFALLVGIALHKVRDKTERIIDLSHALAEMMYAMTHIVMAFAPFGIFALIAALTAEQGLGVLMDLLKILGTVYLACILHVILVYGGLLKFIARLPIIPFFKKAPPAQLLAFSTSSSAATLPLTLEVAQEKLGVSKSSSSFVLPLGCTINMDGTALYQGVCALFVAQVMGIDLTLMQYVTIILTATLASIGSAGVPGAGLIMLTLVLSSVGLPIAAVAIIAGIDRILDMARSAVNVTGDLVVSICVDKSENQLDEKMYLSNE
ncbi:MAG: dicarboxylate/amino acid:cation symporter [Alphaproteobacteria bacterium]|nr:dicarboxylate/amino acid:cation symporter [Alphaproteobacteria bacterium]